MVVIKFIYIKGRPRMNWDADDLGPPPRGPRDRDYHMPREYADVGFFDGDKLHPVSAGPADIDRHRVHNSKFEMRTRPEYAGDWPALCTFSVDDRGDLIQQQSKNGFPSTAHFKKPWGFVLGQETRSASIDRQGAYGYEPLSHRNPAGRCRDWWTIKVVASGRNLYKLHDMYSMRTHVLWSAPTIAASSATIEAFAQWAQSCGFETICDF
jgi:hypothetical protein